MNSNSTNFENGLHLFGPAMPELFDFTPLFENAFLSIVPSALFLLVLPFRLRSLSKKSRKVSGSFLHGSKLISLAVFTAFQAVILILYASNSSVRTGTSLASASLVFADALGLCFLSHAEHTRTIKPSTIITAYLFITLLFDIARTRTLWLTHAPLPISSVFTLTTILKLFVAITEAVEKRKILLEEYRGSSPESTSGLYNRSFFWWLNTLMRIGYQRVIKAEDIFPLDSSLQSSVLAAAAQTSWDATKKSRKHALFWAILYSTRLSLLTCVFPRLCLIGFRYAQPFLLARTVNFVSSQDADSIGWGLTGAFGIVFVGMAVSNGAYYHMAFRFVTAVRGSLVGLIYVKTVDLSITALNESAAITLMSNDTETICISFQALHEIWAVPIELGIAIWLLQRQLGISFLAPASVALISTASVMAISNYVGAAQKKWNQGIQTRVDVTTSMLGSMKAVKLLGFTDKLREILQGLRVKELKIASLFRKQLVVRVFFANSMNFVAPLVTLTVFVLVSNSTGQQLDTARAYTTLSLIALLVQPLNTLLRTIPSLNSALACFGRIQSFLESESRRVHVLPLPLTTGPGSSTAKLDPSSGFIGESSESGLDIELQDLSPLPNQKTAPNTPMIISHSASFSWSHLPDTPPIVSDISFTLPSHSTLFIIGPVGSGKSTLLRGLMSETPSLKGFVYSSVKEIAFVDQTPWIQNTSIKQNVLGLERFDVSWYEEVMRVCELVYDARELPDGDETLVGSRGISLSGGQKQRLALARALYAKKQLLIIDDGFSGLDAETEEKVFSRLFGKTSLLKRLGTTVIFATHAVHRLPLADQILALDAKGCAAEQGTWEELRERRGGYVSGLVAKSRQNERKVANEDGEIHEVPMESKQSTSADAVKPKSSPEDSDPTIRTTELSTYAYYFRSIGYSRTFLSLIYFLFAGTSIKLTELLVKYWTASVSLHGNSVNAFYLGIYGMLAGISIIMYPVGVYHYFMYVVPGSAEELHRRLLEAVMGAPLSFFAATDEGVTTNRFSQDMSVVDGELPFALVDLIFSVIQTSMGAILMCLSAGYFTLTMPVVGLAVWVLQKFYLLTSRRIRILDLEAKSPLYTHFLSTLSGLPTIRAFNWGPSFISLNLQYLDTSQKPYYHLFLIQRWLALAMDLMVSVLAIILMVLVVKLRHTIGAGYVGLALLNVTNFSQSLTWIVRQWTALETSIGAIARLKSFAEDTPCENLEGEIGEVPENWPERGNISIRNLSASYTTLGTEILKNLSMEIRAGEKIGICGRSGSGKSSFLMTLFRMLEVSSSSSLLVDGVDITRIPRQKVRSRFSAIPQDPFFMKGTIRFNASPECTGTERDADIIAALKKVQLWSVVEIKGGLGADLEAETFSHGQRQLFCLARALLRRSKVVCMDELSSSIDIATDRLIQKVIREEFRNATVVVVAHRLETIVDFERVAVMSDGRLVEFEDPQVLLGRQSAFRELWNS